MVCATTNLRGQTLVNKEWSRTTGLPDAINWSGTTFDNEKNLVFAGNTLISPGNADILVTKFNANGQIVWQRTAGGTAGMNDYGVAVTTDALNNIYVAGAMTAPNTMFDFVVLKYSPQGNLEWTRTWDGSQNLQDVPTCIKLDDNANIYVAGGTTNFTTQVNYAVLKLNNSGVIQWVREYDYTGLYDFATAIETRTDGKLVVTGASASAANAWDYATLLLNDATGVIEDTKRVLVPEVGLDQALAVTRDANNNMYITGYSDRNGNKNIQTLKLNSNFGLEWVKTFDNAGLEDVAKAIECDAFGNVYIAGHTTTSDEGVKFVTIKYAPNGDLVWEKEYKLPAGGDAKAADIAVSDNGDVYVSGTSDNGNNKDFATLKYNAQGQLKFAKQYEAIGNEEAANIEVDTQGNIYVSGKSKDANDVQSYLMVKYGEWDRPEQYVYNTQNQPTHIADELIVKFTSSALKTDFVNNKEILFAKPTDVLQDNVIDALERALLFPIRGNKDVRFTKIYPFLTTDDTISISRLGERVPVPAFWSSLLMEIPKGQDMEVVKTALTRMFPIVNYAENNGLLHLTSTPNDSFFNKQHSLISTAFPNGHINIDSAWNITTGKKDIKVGVYDMPIDWKHPDFGGQNFSNSVVKGGTDYGGLQSIELVDTIFYINDDVIRDHGTRVAGIIGAMRNNNFGVAGIAGGDLSRRDSGVSLYSLGIFKLTATSPNTAFVGATDVANAITRGALSGGTNYGLNIQNHSWGGGNYLEVRNAVRTAFTNNSICVASRGNDGVFDALYPSCYDDDWVISVGASGGDGRFKTGHNGDYWWQSQYGRNVDIIAPGSIYQDSTNSTLYGTLNGYNSTFIFTTNPRGYPLKYYNNIVSDYSAFNGTSASAPHVSGVIALMLSLHNTRRGYPNNLSIEDVEFIVQKYATDITGTALVDSCSGGYIVPNTTRTVAYQQGYDIYNGWGRLNAGASIRMIDTPRYQILHPSDAPNSYSKVLVRNSNIVLLDEVNGIAAGNYQADVYRGQENYVYNTPTNYRIVDVWKRLSSTKSYYDTTTIRDDPWMNFSAVLNTNRTQVNITASGYFYKLYLPNNVTKWIPYDPDNIKKFQYSIHLEDKTMTALVDVQGSITKFNVFPNPTSTDISVDYQLENIPNNIQVDIFDIVGQLMQSKILSPVREGIVTLNGQTLAQGTYLVRLTVDNQSIYKKVVKL
jgi:uncharacterized delta-60 repeat protein